MSYLKRKFQKLWVLQVSGFRQFSFPVCDPWVFRNKEASCGAYWFWDLEENLKVLPLGQTGQNKSDLQTCVGFPKAVKEFKTTSAIDLKVNKVVLRMQSTVSYFATCKFCSKGKQTAVTDCPHRTAS